MLFTEGAELRLVDAATGKRTRTLSGDGVNSRSFFEFGRDGSWVAYSDRPRDGKPGEYHVWDLVTGDVRRLEGCDAYQRIQVIESGIVGDVWSKPEHRLALWDPRTGKKVRDLPHPPVAAVPARRGAGRAPDGTKRRRRGEVRNLESGEPLPASADPLGDVLELEYLTAGTLTARLCVSGPDANIRDTCRGGRVTLDTRSGRIARLPGSDRLEYPLDVSNDGRAAVCGAIRPKNSTLEVVDPTGRAPRRDLEVGFTEG